MSARIVSSSWEQVRPYSLPGLCAIHGRHVSNVVCPKCVAASPAASPKGGDARG